MLYSTHMKKTTKKKVISKMKKLARNTSKGIEKLERKGGKLVKQAKKEWKASEPKRRELENKINKAVKKGEKKAGVMMKNAMIMGKGLERGWKSGMKEINKGGKK